MPSPGTVPQPKMKTCDIGTSSSVPTTVTIAGTRMLPVPRINDAIELKTHTRMAPAKTQFEYVIAASSDAPWPPIRV